jgi:hypothetical protein
LVAAAAAAYQLGQLQSFIRTELTKVDETKFGSSTPVLGSVTARENNKQINLLSLYMSFLASHP